MNVEEKLVDLKKHMVEAFPHRDDVYSSEVKYSFDQMNNIVRAAIENYHNNHVKPFVEELVREVR